MPFEKGGKLMSHGRMSGISFAGEVKGVAQERRTAERPRRADYKKGTQETVKGMKRVPTAILRGLLIGL